MKRLLTLSLSLLMALSLLTGCQSGTTNPQPTAPTGTNAPDQTTPTPEGSVLTQLPLVETPDIVERILGISRDTTVMTVNGSPISAEEFLYCLSYATDSLGTSLYGSADAIDWEADVEGAGVRTTLIDSAAQTAQFYGVIRSKAADLGLTLSDEHISSLNVEISNAILNLGGDEAYANRLQGLAISDKGFRGLNEINLYYDVLQNALLGDRVPTDEEITTYAETTADALMAKHILIKTVDDNYLPLSEEEQAAAKAKAEGLLAQLRSSEDPIALFDVLMNENSEDGRDSDGNLYQPDGYLFTANQMVAEFEAGTRALDYNEISDLVESDYGYHIILRLRPITDAVRESYLSNQMDQLIDQWMEEATVERGELLSAIDPKDFYEKLAAIREELEPSSTPSAEPEA